MGAYLSEPVTTKISCDKSNDKLSYGASGMQGWRVSMEDAHSCILDYDEDTSLFAVYDGHGGSEVATYTADNLPKFLKNIDEYKDGDLKACIVNGFLGFDQHLLEDEVMTELRNLAGLNNSEQEDELDSLAHEAEMPIEELLLKLKEGGYHVRKVDEDEASPTKESGEGESSKPIDSEGIDVKKTEEKEIEQKNGKLEEMEKRNEKIEEVEKKNEKVEELEKKNEKVEELEKKNGEIEDVKEEKMEESKKEDKEEKEKKYVEEEKPKKSVEKVEEDEDDESDDEEDSDDSDDDGDDEDDDDNTNHLDGDEVGYDSGTTAVVAFLKKDYLVVGNVGDSRCVLCRDGLAIDMSHDHKPENDQELTRIRNAGGRVTGDGRVNGGLNLSRAIGDHRYKGTSHLGADEQQITAMPDVKEIEITEADRFLVLACDGIWNVLSSQQVVDFVSERLEKQIENDKISLSKICEGLFERCLSGDTEGDGTGCDNMTAIIVLLTKDLTKKTKRKQETDDENSAKKPRTE